MLLANPVKPIKGEDQRSDRVLGFWSMGPTLGKVYSSRKLPTLLSVLCISTGKSITKNTFQCVNIGYLENNQLQ